MLATLYRNLCRAVNKGVHDISECFALLQSWIWFRISELRPPSTELHFPLLRGRVMKQKKKLFSSLFVGLLPPSFF